MSASNFPLGIANFVFSDLFRGEKLIELQLAWENQLAPNLKDRYFRYRHEKASDLTLSESESDLLLELAHETSRFISLLFAVEDERRAGLAKAQALDVLWRFKDEFVKRRALKRRCEDYQSALATGAQILADLGLSETDRNDETAVARVIVGLLDQEHELKKRPAENPELTTLSQTLVALETWMVAVLPARRAIWSSCAFPQPTADAKQLVHFTRPLEKLPELMVGSEAKRRPRDGFALTDRRMPSLQIADQVAYCLYCHDRAKDSCSSGLKDGKTGSNKKNALGVELAGCPLDERISEMHLLKRRGDSLAALAMVCIDNPMLPGTGHRICNDCMKSCIYQKQEPVNIPQIETAVLTDVLRFPYGFEIYSLLTRWNPLDARRPVARPYRGKNVLVVGMGPAGYTLAQHLLNEGFGVVGIDGLKIEPLPGAWVGNPKTGEPPEPIRDVETLYAKLEERTTLGFGGVSEYGITVRWDKNFLTLLYITLARRSHFRVYGGIRFGGTLTLDDAWQLGIHHVAIAVGAGKPTLVDMENNLIRGVRQASDFLMALQLTGAFKRSSPANLQVRLPAVVIGGGLTAVDTATELLAYYIVQAEKTLERYEKICALSSPAEVKQCFDREELAILEELLDHGERIREERKCAQAAARPPDFAPLLHAWGGVTLVYRKQLTDSPAYRLNHEEVEKCLEEGVHILECMAPQAAIADDFGAIRGLRLARQAIDSKGNWTTTGEPIDLPARTVCIAAGTSPNTIYEREFPGTFTLDSRGYFLAHRAERNADGTINLVVDPNGFFTSYNQEGHLVSYYGDNHPRFAGSVVKAMASAKQGYGKVSELFPETLTDHHADYQRTWADLTERLDEELKAEVVAVHRLTPSIVELVVKAPRAARRFLPGQFYRLQNFESYSPTVDGTKLTLEGIALTGASTNLERGHLSLIVLEMGHSSRLCAQLQPGDPVVVMGPTGTPTEIEHDQTVVLVGGGLGNAVLFSIGKALRQAGCHVLYLAGYKCKADIFHAHEIEAAANQIVWSVDVGDPYPPGRRQDASFVGNVVQALIAYAHHQFGDIPYLDLQIAQRFIAIGSDRMMRAVKEARHGMLGPFLRPDHIALGSINSPMQCMMKEICAQCLQRHVDPKTGKESFVFSCFNQDQPLDFVDFDNLRGRLKTNSVQEKLTLQWIDHLLMLHQVNSRPSTSTNLAENRTAPA